jgi:hypothetical protein
MTTKAPPRTRFRAERVTALAKIAKQEGGIVRVNAITGDCTLEFPDKGKAVDREEAQRLEEAMNRNMPPAKRAS